MLKIRLQRTGRRNNPSYRVVVIESSVAVRKGKSVEVLGTHDTVRKVTSLRNDRIAHWIAQGAQVSDTMHNILVTNGVIEGVKVNALPKKRPIVQQEEETDASADSGASDESSDTGEAASPEAEQTDADDEKESSPPVAEQTDADAETEPSSSPDTPSAER